MSPVVEEPLDRLNYFNGQRLVAADLRVEQDYHIRVRRLLNRRLYTPGIAGGLEVKVSLSSPRKVSVSAGVAIDALGREVILVEDTEVEVVGVPSTEADWVFGNYLTIEYAEETVSAVQDGCTVKSEKCDLAWGGPTRIRATPRLSFQSAWPNEAAGLVMLGQVELGAGCEVVHIHNGVRKYVDAADSTVRSYALEGEKDIDGQNSKVLSFHIKGGPPSSVLLYLRGARIPRRSSTRSCRSTTTGWTWRRRKRDSSRATRTPWKRLRTTRQSRTGNTRTASISPTRRTMETWPSD